MMNPFHLAIPVNDLIKTTYFYQNVLGCQRGRSSNSWIDFNLFGHQLVCHYVENAHTESTNPVDGDEVPVPHFGVILSFDQFDDLLHQLQKKEQTFVIEPKIRFAGQPGEQRTMFLKDPSGNALEFKAFKNLDSLFRT
jgi:extradiol dioxygenase family protein